jgi:hypothetical protein
MAMGEAEGVDLVTVCFEDDLPLLQLQARSIAINLKADANTKIFVILNSFQEENLRVKFDQEILPLYGPWASNVIAINGSVLLPHCEDVRLISKKRYGWYRQQWLKLVSCKIVTGSNFIVLDAKNHFLRGAHISEAFDELGRSRIRKMRTAGPLLEYFHEAQEFFAIPAPRREFPVLPSITPFTFSTKIVLELIDEVKFKSNMDEREFFCKCGTKFSEFLLYHAYLDYRGIEIDKAFAFDDNFSFSVFQGSKRELKILKEIAKKDLNCREIFLAVHRSLFVGQYQELLTVVSELWLDVGIFETQKELDDFLKNLQVV